MLLFVLYIFSYTFSIYVFLHAQILCAVPSVGINHLSNAGETPLHVACRMGKTESALAFLRCHARCDILGKDGYPIHTAMKHSMKG